MVHPWYVSLVSNGVPGIYIRDTCGGVLKFHTIHWSLGIQRLARHDPLGLWNGSAKIDYNLAQR